MTVHERTHVGIVGAGPAGLPHNGIYLQFDGERHHVPPTGAKGLNPVVADVAALATALIRLLHYDPTTRLDPPALWGANPAA